MLCVADVWFLCTALFHNVLYQFMKFTVESFYSLDVKAQIKNSK